VLTIVPVTPASQALIWPGGGALYRATNVLGPYVPLPGVTSPYTNHATGQGFFRVGP